MSQAKERDEAIPANHVAVDHVVIDKRAAQIRDIVTLVGGQIGNEVPATETYSINPDETVDLISGHVAITVFVPRKHYETYWNRLNPLKKVKAAEKRKTRRKTRTTS